MLERVWNEEQIIKKIIKIIFSIEKYFWEVYYVIITNRKRIQRFNCDNCTDTLSQGGLTNEKSFNV